MFPAVNHTSPEEQWTNLLTNMDKIHWVSLCMCVARNVVPKSPSPTVHPPHLAAPLPTAHHTHIQEAVGESVPNVLISVLMVTVDVTIKIRSTKRQTERPMVDAVRGKNRIKGSGFGLCRYLKRDSVVVERSMREIVYICHSGWFTKCLIFTGIESWLPLCDSRVAGIWHTTTRVHPRVFAELRNEAGWYPGGYWWANLVVFWR